jgi:hypothetical protein
LIARENYLQVTDEHLQQAAGAERNGLNIQSYVTHTSERKPAGRPRKHRSPAWRARK